MNYNDYNSGLGMLAIFDIVNGGPATILTMSSLGAYDYQSEVQVSPDGRSLLMQNYYDNNAGYNIMVYDIATNPKSPALLATITGNVPRLWPTVLVFLSSGWQPAVCFGQQYRFCIGIQLRCGALQLQPTGVLYGARRFQPQTMAVSPDGAWVYLQNNNPDMITVLDANLLAGGQPPLHHQHRHRNLAV